MRTLIIIAAAVWATASAADYNSAAKDCLSKLNYSPENFDNFDWSKASACAGKYRDAMQAAKYAELRDFLDANPRYRVPGQSLNRCWGKPREMPFESAGIETNGNSMRAWVNYKDTMPAGCYENAPWDNRDLK